MAMIVYDNKEMPEVSKPYKHRPIPEHLLLEGPNEITITDLKEEEALKEKRLRHLRDTVGRIMEPDTFREFPWEDGDEDYPLLKERAKNLTVHKDASWAEKLKRRSVYTPDFRTLKFQSQILIFVYGAEKRNKLHSGLLEGATPLGGAHTVFKHYMLKEILPGVPLALERPTGEDGKAIPDTAALRGEAYLVSVEHIHLLDLLHMNGVRAERKWRHIAFETVGLEGDRKFMGRNGVSLALMYSANKTMFSPESGKTISPNYQSFVNNPCIPDGKYVTWFY